MAKKAFAEGEHQAYHFADRRIGEDEGCSEAGPFADPSEIMRQEGGSTTLSSGDCVVMANKGGEAVRFQSFRMRVF